MAGRQHASRNTTLDTRRQAQKSNGVGDLWSTASDSAGELLLAAAEVIKKLLLGRSLLKCIEL